MNKVILIGRLTRDPELNYAPGNGTAVTRFTLAVARPFKKDETDFINCVAFGKTGETIAQYLSKGRQLAIEGHIQTGSYEAKDSTKRYTTDVIVDRFEFIGQGKQEQKEENPFDNGGMNFEEDMTPVNDGDMPF